MPASIRWAELTDFEALKRSRLNRLRGATKKPSNPSDCHALVELAGRRARCDERKAVASETIPSGQPRAASREALIRGPGSR
jgi:hypothetical protein